ncbi:MAG TPA: cellulase family glycosylhydrolase [Longimicrobiaceae bacterium]|nr:cellulase family glycosylhydrolase [Longimicrobiaceae bacterium]
MLIATSLAACEDIPIDPQPIEYRCEAGSVVADGTPIATAPGGYAVVGNQIISIATCKPFRFVGVSRPALSFSPDGGRMGIDTAAAADFARIRGWKANTVRIELAQYYWVNTSRHHDPGYASRVDRVVKAARAAGLHVILVLQASDRGDPNHPLDQGEMHQPMADVNHSIPFWKEVAARYKDDGGVLFELYSEPYPLGGRGGFSNWDLWLKGGLHPADNVYGRRGPFQAAGMQQLYDAVRSTGAHNLVIASGTQWGYYLDGVPSHRIKGYNIAYSTHPWEDSPDSRQPSAFDRDWAFLAATDPVMITEFGDYDCTDRYVRAVLDKADHLGLSWTAWMWVAPGPTESRKQEGRDDPICNRSLLILDWAGTPTKPGQIIKDRLASY